MSSNSRHSLVELAAGSSLLATPLQVVATLEDQSARGMRIAVPDASLDVFGYLRKLGRIDDRTLYLRILGAANEFKEGDAALGVAAADQASRENARLLLGRTRLRDLDAVPVIEDALSRLLKDSTAAPDGHISPPETLDELKRLLIDGEPELIQGLAPSLSSVVIGCVVKLMTNADLITVGSKIFNRLGGSYIGAKGYLGARVQPNSPTDNVEDICWQVFDAWAYAVGDVVLGTNPVSSEPQSVAMIEFTLQDVLSTFGIADALPHCVLAHIDVQAQVEEEFPGSTALWFQSIAGTDGANATFDVSIDEMLEYAAQRTGPFGLYFETGQGADYTNGHGHGFDMVLHESRKYGFARALKQRVAAARDIPVEDAWVHLNDVAGFIGPEVFRSREQLVRCCLEDIVMGKLHGLTIGLDVCSTLHMDVSLDDLDWCLDEIMPANPAYLMALPTKIDPMLGYLTTGFQDHVRLRQKFGYRVNDRMWKLFQELGVIDAAGQPTEHFGDPTWVYLHYRRRKGDTRSDGEVLEEARRQVQNVRDRGVLLAEGSGAAPWELEPTLKNAITQIYEDAKHSIWAEWDPQFVKQIPAAVTLQTESIDRNDYILHPTSGEVLAAESQRRVETLRQQHQGDYDVQIVISEGLNALSLMDDGQLEPFLKTLRTGLDDSGLRVAPENLVVTAGRVRAGYQIGEILFASLPGRRAILHVIGERPGSGHHTFSIYMTTPDGSTWSRAGTVDHNITRVVSGIALTTLRPEQGATDAVRILNEMRSQP